MAKIEINVKVKTTEALQVILAMKDDIQELFELVPDHCYLEKEQVQRSLDKKWRKMCELIEFES